MGLETEVAVTDIRVSCDVICLVTVRLLCSTWFTLAVVKYTVL